jgi:membrane-associated phospholipid phosphatase
MPFAFTSALALVCFATTALLATYVSTRLPPRIDIAGTRLRGTATPLAALFTLLGRWYSVGAIALACAGLAALTGRPVLPFLVLLVSQTLSQGAVSIIKRITCRSRPANWLLRLESDSSYPSGHAATAIVFFGGLIAIVRTSHVPPGAAGIATALLLICAAGIPWSRLALGAHYVTDVAGGLAFGGGWLAMTLELFARYGPGLGP